MPTPPSPPAKVQNSDDYVFSDQIGHLLRRAYQRHIALFQTAIPDSELTAAQFVTLCAIRKQDACSLNDIVKATAIDQATIRGVVERLKKRALVSVSADPDDKRKLIVRATAKGRALTERTIPFARDVTEQTFGSLNPGERVALDFLLRAMMRAEEP